MGCGCFGVLGVPVWLGGVVASGGVGVGCGCFGVLGVPVWLGGVVASGGVGVVVWVLGVVVWLGGVVASGGVGVGCGCFGVAGCLCGLVVWVFLCLGLRLLVFCPLMCLGLVLCPRPSSVVSECGGVVVCVIGARAVFGVSWCSLVVGWGLLVWVG